MGKRGFTLVELIAMLTVLSIIMMITIPNITGMVEGQKLLGIKQDATKMMDRVKVKIASKEDIKKPSNKKCIVFTLKDINGSDDFTEGPNGKPYLLYNSFVAMCRNNKVYEYFIRLVEDNTTNLFGINFTNYANLVNEENNPNTMIYSFSKASFETDTKSAENSIKNIENQIEEKLKNKAKEQKKDSPNYTYIVQMDRDILNLKDSLANLKENGTNSINNIIKRFVATQLPTGYTRSASTIEKVYT